MSDTSDRWSKVRGIWEIIDRLRGEGGCPWDRKQTPEKVQTYLIEEAHEAASAIRAGNAEEAGEELGDLLFMVLFMVHLYEESGDFRLEDVCDLIMEKMIRRHPHVFGDVRVDSADEVRDNWAKIKAREKTETGKEGGGVPESLPALMRAYRLISRKAHDDAGWNDMTGQLEAFSRKSEVLRESLRTGAPVSGRSFGELLLLLVNLARIGKFRAEDVLHEILGRDDSDWQGNKS